MNNVQFRELFRQQLHAFGVSALKSLSADAQAKFAMHLRSLCVADPRTLLNGSKIAQKLKTGLKLHDLEIYFEEQGDGGIANIYRPNGGLTLPGYKIEIVGQMSKFEVSGIDKSAKIKTKKKIIECQNFDALVRYMMTLKKAASLITRVKPKKIKTKKPKAAKTHKAHVHQRIAKIAKHVAKHKRRKRL